MRPGLRVKRVQGSESLWEMRFCPDDRAMFQYGEPVHPGEPHIIWLRIGTHDIFREP